MSPGSLPSPGVTVVFCRNLAIWLACTILLGGRIVFIVLLSSLLIAVFGLFSCHLSACCILTSGVTMVPSLARFVCGFR